jgi:hypothetical protein
MNENVVKAEQAFNQASAGYELWGKQLEPFSAMRQACAAAMGLRFGLVDEADIFRISVETLKDDKKKKQDLQFYNQMFQDVIIVLWLCSVSGNEVLKALRNTDRAKEKAFIWADDHEIGITSTQYFEAAAVFFQIMVGIASSTGVPQPVEGEEPDEDPNE